MHVVQPLRQNQRKSAGSLLQSDDDGDEQEVRVSQRALYTHESVLNAEENRWECEYHLAANENNRLQNDINTLHNHLEAM